MSKKTYSAEDKFNILKEWEDGNYSLNELKSIFSSVAKYWALETW
ncbi:hypothetical protein IKE_06221 [Bacillus cereus VD196]|uniref:Transposase n=1 Tax=Bacillus cereus VD196 TaxID=1053243 RepID=A0A9W5PXX3_BACCE|nr:hypothetical protein IKG_06102 [Bacillus cereus VD200]EOO58910.1 hypothetical protein IKE_06221 [Bacillus cereus VD196]